MNPKDSDALIDMFITSILLKDDFKKAIFESRLSSAPIATRKKVLRGVFKFLIETDPNSIKRRLRIESESNKINQNLLSNILVFGSIMLQKKLIDDFLMIVKKMVEQEDIPKEKFITITKNSLALLFIEPNLLNFIIENNLIEISNKFCLKLTRPQEQNLEWFLKNDRQKTKDTVKSNIKLCQFFDIDYAPIFSRNTKKIVFAELFIQNLENISKLILKKYEDNKAKLCSENTERSLHLVYILNVLIDSKSNHRSLMLPSGILDEIKIHEPDYFDL